MDCSNLMLMSFGESSRPLNLAYVLGIEELVQFGQHREHSDSMHRKQGYPGEY